MARNDDGTISFTVHRGRWLSGGLETTTGQFISSRLLAPAGSAAEGKMCCLGFLARELGYDPEEILDRATPGSTQRKYVDDAKEYRNLWPDSLMTAGLDTHLCARIMAQNDAPIDGGTVAREQVLAQLFAQAGITVTFVDGDG